MPASVTSDAKRSPALLTVLFWIGVALAPVAALILLVADGNGPLRFAAVLAILAVVLIGLSIALRADGEGGQARSEELLDEMEQLRRELRGEIVAAAQRGNQALDQAQRAQEAVAAVHRRMESTSAALAGGTEAAGAGRARVSAAVEPAEEAPPGRGRAAQEDAAPRWGRPDWEDDEEPRRAQPNRHAADRPAPGQHGAERPPAAGYGERPDPAGVYGERPEPAGVYGERPDPAGVYGERPEPARGYGERPGPAGVHGERPGSAGVYGGDRPAAAQPGVYGAAARPAEHDGRAAAEPHRPVGMVRHTETVHVTTRHTIVDGGSAEPAGGRYGGGYAGAWSPPAEERAWGGSRPDEHSWAGTGPEERSRPGYAAPDERSRPGDDRRWAGQPDPRAESGWEGQRDERGRADRRDDRSRSAPEDQRGWSEQPVAGEPSWGVPAERPGPERPDDTGQYWAQLRAGDRWAAVRDDDRGRELRIGERHAEVHADATGTEYRVADRWASVRREEPRRDESRRDEPRRDYDRGGDEGWRGGWAEPEERPGLPAGGVPVPDEWRPPRQRGYQPTDVEPERVSRRARGEEEYYGYPPQDDVPRAGGARADRWR
ncbi:hypothetical protein [Micromonospora sp. NPDC051006]|uniref:hypothetical protein n=1 Tax=Micromonospora sp. NPDC051006 TaxID=3364283 RepID=UPI00379E83A7